MEISTLKNQNQQYLTETAATHLLITGGGDTGFCLFLTSVLVLRLPEPSFTEEPLMQFQLITGLFPAHAALHMQSVNIDCDILNVLGRNPGPVGAFGSVGGNSHSAGRVKSGLWTLPTEKSICNNLTKADTQGLANLEPVPRTQWLTHCPL